MILLSTNKVWLGFNVMAVYEVSRHGPKIIYRFNRHPDTSREVVEETLLIFLENQYYSLLELVAAVSRWMFSVPDLLQGFWFVHSAIGKINPPLLFGKLSPLSHWVFSSRFPMRPSFPTPQGLRSVRHPSKFPPRTERIRGTIQVRLFFPNWWILDWSFAVIGWWCSTNEPNGIVGSLNGCPNVFHRASSHKIIDLWRFADRCNIP